MKRAKRHRKLTPFASPDKKKATNSSSKPPPQPRLPQKPSVWPMPRAKPRKTQINCGRNVIWRSKKQKQRRRNPRPPSPPPPCPCHPKRHLPHHLRTKQQSRRRLRHMFKIRGQE